MHVFAHACHSSLFLSLTLQGHTCDRKVKFFFLFILVSSLLSLFNMSHLFFNFSPLFFQLHNLVLIILRSSVIDSMQVLKACN